MKHPPTIAQDRPVRASRMSADSDSRVGGRRDAPEHHWIWLLRYMKGETVQEIAADYGVTAPCVRVAVVRLGVRFGPREERLPRSVTKAYFTQKSQAGRRGIAWEFTLESWWAVWSASDKWDERGNKRGQYVMARFEDRGPYAPWNVRITHCTDNILEGVRLRQRRVIAQRAGQRGT